MSQYITPSLYVGKPEDTEEEWEHGATVSAALHLILGGQKVYVDTLEEAHSVLGGLVDEEFADDQFAILSLKLA